jgi:tetratricopeptide (TPR) repeat protein
MFDTRTIAKVLMCWICLSGPAWAKDNVELGNEAFGQADYGKAIEYYKQAIEAKPTFAAYANLGHCYMQLERWGEAASAYEEAIRIKPDDVTAEILRALGRARFESRQYDKAMDAYLKASSLEPGKGRDDVWIARCMIELEQWIQAQSVLLGQLRREPRDTVTLELLAYVYNQQNNWSGIIGIYRELLDIAPERTTYRVALAKALTVQGQRQQAIDMLEFARRVDLGSGPEIDRLLADLYLAEEMPQEAAGCYARLIRTLDKPSAEDCYRLGLAYFQAGDLASAEEAFRHMQQVNPADFKADLYLGHVVAEAGRVDEAQAHYRAALEKDPTSVECLVALADLQIKGKHPAEAASNLAKAIALGDTRGQVYYNYILALMDGKNESSVRAALKAALAEHPSDERLSRLLDRHVEQITQPIAIGR